MPRRKPENPWEALTEEFSERYVELVMQATKHYAPHRPWWSADLSPEAQLYRYLEIRPDIIGWLVDLSDYLGWTSTEEMLHGIAQLATSPEVEFLIPGELAIDERGDALKELVQAAGPADAQAHIVKMETMALRRSIAEGLMADARQEAGFDVSTEIPAPESFPPESVTAYPVL